MVAAGTGRQDEGADRGSTRRPMGNPGVPRRAVSLPAAYSERRINTRYSLAHKFPRLVIALVSVWEAKAQCAIWYEVEEVA